MSVVGKFDDVLEVEVQKASEGPKARAKVNEVKKFVDAEKIALDVTFSDLDLTGAMMKQASLFAYYAAQSARANHQVQKFKLLLDVQESKLDKEIREAALEDGGKKITEAMIEKEIKRDARYVKARMNLLEAQQIADLAKDTLEALKQRRDMLVQIGVTMREERKGELYLKGKDAGDANSQALRERALEIASGKS
jgi:hypothetical protein